MDNETIKNNYLKVIQVHIKLIKANINKLPNHFKFYEDDNIIKGLKNYEKSNVLEPKYYDLLSSVGKFITKYDINIDEIDKSTIKLINDYQRIYSLNKPYYREP